MKNKDVASSFYKTDIGKLISVSLCLFLKNDLKIYSFLFLEVLLTRFWVPKLRLIQSHMLLFWDL